MYLIDPNNPMYNTMFFYTIIMLSILFIKPTMIYSYDKKTFKQFGCNDGQTLLSLPVIAFISAILLYIIFLTVDIMNKYIG